MMKTSSFRTSFATTRRRSFTSLESMTSAIEAAKGSAMEVVTGGFESVTTTVTTSLADGLETMTNGLESVTTSLTDGLNSVDLTAPVTQVHEALVGKPTRRLRGEDSTARNIFCDMVGAEFIIGRVQEVADNPEVVKLEIEDLFAADRCHKVMPTLEKIVFSNDREWKEIRFVDTLDLDDFPRYSATKGKIMAEYEGFDVHLPTSSLSGVFSWRAQVVIPLGTPAEDILQLFKNVKADNNIVSLSLDLGAGMKGTPEDFAGLIAWTSKGGGFLTQQIEVDLLTSWSQENKNAYSLLLNCCIYNLKRQRTPEPREEVRRSAMRRRRSSRRILPVDLRDVADDHGPKQARGRARETQEDNLAPAMPILNRRRSSSAPGKDGRVYRSRQHAYATPEEDNTRGKGRARTATQDYYGEGQLAAPMPILHRRRSSSAPGKNGRIPRSERNRAAAAAAAAVANSGRPSSSRQLQCPEEDQREPVAAPMPILHRRRSSSAPGKNGRIPRSQRVKDVQSSTRYSQWSSTDNSAPGYAKSHTVCLSSSMARFGRPTSVKSLMDDSEGENHENIMSRYRLDGTGFGAEGMHVASPEEVSAFLQRTSVSAVREERHGIPEYKKRHTVCLDNTTARFGRRPSSTSLMDDSNDQSSDEESDDGTQQVNKNEQRGRSRSIRNLTVEEHMSIPAPMESLESQRSGSVDGCAPMPTLRRKRSNSAPGKMKAGCQSEHHRAALSAKAFLQGSVERSSRKQRASSFKIIRYEVYEDREEKRRIPARASSLKEPSALRNETPDFCWEHHRASLAERKPKRTNSGRKQRASSVRSLPDLDSDREEKMDLRTFRRRKNRSSSVHSLPDMSFDSDEDESRVSKRKSQTKNKQKRSSSTSSTGSLPDPSCDSDGEEIMDLRTFRKKKRSSSVHSLPDMCFDSDNDEHHLARKQSNNKKKEKRSSSVKGVESVESQEAEKKHSVRHKTRSSSLKGRESVGMDSRSSRKKRSNSAKSVKSTGMDSRSSHKKRSSSVKSVQSLESDVGQGNGLKKRSSSSSHCKRSPTSVRNLGVCDSHKEGETIMTMVSNGELVQGGRRPSRRSSIFQARSKSDPSLIQSMAIQHIARGGSLKDLMTLRQSLDDAIESKATNADGPDYDWSQGISLTRQSSSSSRAA